MWRVANEATARACVAVRCTQNIHTPIRKYTNLTFGRSAVALLTDLCAAVVVVWLSAHTKACRQVRLHYVFVCIQFRVSCVVIIAD